jgi:TolB-like protein/DNA-binding winged helix-turn-helix (wHTH) protein/Tfp pilus assembly protein PilF
MGFEGEEASDGHRGYRFGAFTLDIDRASLFEQGKALPLRPQSFDVLLYLVERHGCLVEKQQLIEAIWGRTAVTDDSLTHCLIDIRKVLGDAERTLIRTVPRRGYIFDVSVEPLVQSRGNGAKAGRLSRSIQLAALAIVVIGAAYLSLRVADRPVAGPQRFDLGPVAENSIAVLPFVDMSKTQEYAYFGDGLAEEILNSLARNSGLRVTARTSSFNYKNSDKDVSVIAQELRVANVLEGSVRVAGDRAVVTAQLVSGGDGMHIWSETFDRRLDNTVKAQREIAQAVARLLSTTILGGGEPDAGVPDNAEAYDAYLQARFLFHRRGPRDLDNARALFHRATDLEPDFARAWAGLAGTYYVEYSDTPSGDERLLQQLKEAAERAVAINQNLAEGWLRLSGYYSLTGDAEAAQRQFSRALAAQPDDPLLQGIMAGREALEGNLGMAIQYQRRALERNPLSAVDRSNLSFYLLAAGEYEEAMRVKRMAQVLHPDSQPTPDTLQVHALIKLGRYAEALDVIEAWPQGPDRDSAEAMARLALGHNWRARLPIRRLSTDNSLAAHVRLAELRAFCLEIDSAFVVLAKINQGLRRGESVRQPAFAFFSETAWSPFLEPVRDDVRWADWLQQFRALTLDADASKAVRTPVKAAGAMSGSTTKSVR